VLVRHSLLMFLVPPPNGFEPFFLFQSKRASGQELQCVAGSPDLAAD
jgi:hypothetical protein